MLLYLDQYVFLHPVFCIEQLYGFPRIIFRMFLRKKKWKITCLFCKGYRLKKMKDFQNALISRPVGVFARRLLQTTTLLVPYIHFQNVFAKKKVENNLPIWKGYRLSKMEDFQNALISRRVGVFTRRLLHRTTLWVP